MEKEEIAMKSRIQVLQHGNTYSGADKHYLSMQGGDPAPHKSFTGKRIKEDHTNVIDIEKEYLQ